jgi:hypothetical protein
LTGNVDLDPFGYVPFAFLPDANDECLFHNFAAVIS